MNGNYQDKIASFREAYASANHILVGAGAGLSTSDGLHYGGDRFQKNFPDYIEKYGLTDMYSSAFFSFPTREERWGYWSRHIKLNRYDYQPGPVYKKLLEIVNGKNFFVITTNADALFHKSGFQPDKIFAVQGDYGMFQCSLACHDTLYDNEDSIRKIVQEEEDCRIPSELIPVCPVCGEEMDANLRRDRYFIEDKNWHQSAEKYKNYLSDIGENPILLIELGVGYNTPSIIKYPFESITSNYENATLIRINKDHPEVSDQNTDKTIVFDQDIGQVFNDLLRDNT